MNRAARPRLASALVVAVVGVVSFSRASRLEYDFSHFYLDARYVFEHGALNPDLDGPVAHERRQLPFYLPAVAVLLAPLTAGGVMPAAALWALAHMAALGYSLRLLTDWCAHTPPHGLSHESLVVVATIVALPAIIIAAQFNQLSFILLALVLGAVSALERTRPLRSGALFGLAAVLKLLPGLFALWLLLKRQWSALLAFVTATIVCATLPCLVVFGPAKTAEYHRQWWNCNFAALEGSVPAPGSTGRPLREHFVDYRNQSIAEVVRRLCWPAHRHPVAAQLASLDRNACRAISGTIALALGGALVWATRRPSTLLSTVRRRGEAACYALAMLVFSPLLRQYYLVWALPGLVLFVQTALLATSDRGRTASRIGILVWLVGMLAWMWADARAYGFHLAMTITLGILLLAAAAQASPQPRKPDSHEGSAAPRAER